MRLQNIPQPADGKSITPDDVRPMLEQMVKEAVSHIPVPRDGRDYDPDVLQKAVNDAVANIPLPADGKSITPDDVRPMLEQMVKEAVKPYSCSARRSVTMIPMFCRRA
ncbi:putative phage portal protein [Escherichia coli]|uniref:Putative phage portal protein n=1 Tax=Escherichia coli TaxID=562 RepID=A0A377D230_ECOLX|nr:putative phage portal protein [Escherichia coli]